MVEMLKQPVNAPMSMEDQVILLFIASGEGAAQIPVEHIRRFNDGFLRYVKEKYPSVPQDIAQTTELSDESQKLLLQAAEEFAAHWDQ
jgi:F-type H+-transporting ATPase subunit alpha